MMSETENGDVETEASEEQAVDVAEATDADTIRERLPEDIRERLTKKAFTPGSLRRLLRDTYYIGPIGIGTGGWRGIYGGGQPGTELRRPEGALYNFPRSWRYAALQRALETGLIAHVPPGRFAITERGVAVLRLIDECPDCGVQREPFIRHHHYVANPNTGKGHVESHHMVTACPDCGANGYGGDGGNSSASYEDFTRDEDAVERAVEALADIPAARTYGGPREVSEDAASEVPDVDTDAITEVLDEFVDDHTPPSPREVFSATEQGLYGRQAVTIPGEGSHYRFKGTAEAIGVSRTDSEGDIHITLEADIADCPECDMWLNNPGSNVGRQCPKCAKEGREVPMVAAPNPKDPRLKVGMDYHTAVEMNVKDALHHDGEDAEWTGDYWTIAADRLARAVSKLTVAYSEDIHRGWSWTPHSDHDVPEGVTWFTVTVTEDAMAAVSAPMLGVDADGELI